MIFDFPRIIAFQIVKNVGTNADFYSYTRLLENFPGDAFLQRFAQLQCSAGNSPLAAIGRHSALDQQYPAFMDCNSPDADARNQGINFIEFLLHLPLTFIYPEGKPAFNPGIAFFIEYFFDEFYPLIFPNQ